MTMLTIIAYLGICSIILSLINTVYLKSRFLRIFGSCCLLLYSFSLKNTILIIFFLLFGLLSFLQFIQRKARKNIYEIVPVTFDNKIVQLFIKKNESEIKKYFGTIDFSKADNLCLYFFNTDIVGLLAYKIEHPTTCSIFVDYVTPKYRSANIGKHFFIEDLRFWKNLNVDTLEIQSPEREHIPYIEELGFQQSENPTTWTKYI